ncbi:MAG TPA: transglutaminase domain-containing protein [Candidatus Dormibacteraeota bacterium]|nr:transglutaminase domain-containing protein [Candidatus Dormibacteraeota bacterium]
MPSADLGLLVLGGLLPLLAAAVAVGVVAEARGRRRPGARAGGWAEPLLGLTLALVVTMATGAALAGTMFFATRLVYPLAALGVLLAAATARWLPRRRYALPLLALAVATVAVALLYALAAPAAPTAGATPTPTPAPAQVLARLLEPVNVGAAQTYGLALLTFLVGTWVGWWALRERAGLVAAALPTVVLTADLVNVPGLVAGEAFWPVCAAVTAGVALIGEAHQGRVTTRWHRAALPALPGTRRRTTGALLTGAVLLTLLAVAIPPLNQTNFSGRFFHYGPAGHRARGPGRLAPLVGYARQVVPGGALRSDPIPLLTYTTSDPGAVTYLRGVTLDRFANGNWYPSRDPRVPWGPGQVIPDGVTVGVGALPPERARRLVQLTVTLLPGASAELPDLLYAGSPALTPDSPRGVDLIGPRLGSSFTSLQQVVPLGGLAQAAGPHGRIATTGRVSVASPAQLRAAGTDYPAWVLPDAALPPTAPGPAAALRRIARGMVGRARSPYDAAVAIQNALRADETYTLTPPPTPRGQWPILYFLEHSHLGYCQYFAASMGALLRAVGIPARLVVGFGPGAYGYRGGAHLITLADAHTWVEVFFPAYGWVRFEPTPDGFYQPPGTAPTAPLSTRGRGIGRTGVVDPNAISHQGGRRAGLGAGGGGVVVSAPLSLELGAGLVAGFLGLLTAWAWRVRSPVQLRRRLQLLSWIGGGGLGRCETVGELARRVAAGAAGRGAGGLAAALAELATLADRAAFSSTGLSPAQRARWRGTWRPVGRGYVVLAGRAWWGRRRAARAWHGGQATGSDRVGARV